MPQQNYADLDRLKAALDPPITDSADDQTLSALLDVASRSIEQECQRIFWQTDPGTEHLVVPNTATEIHVPELGIVDLTAVEIDTAKDGTFATAVPATNYRLEPVGIVTLNQRPYPTVRSLGAQTWPTDGETLVRLTGTFGFPEVPATIAHATVLLAARLWKRHGAVLGVAGFGEMGPVYVRKTDPDIVRLIEPFKLWLIP